MSPSPDSTLADPQQVIADLNRRLAECTAERDHYKAERDAYKAVRDEAVAQQTATAEALGVIRASPGDLAPVFDAILDKATRLCDAGFGTLWTFDGDRFHTAAVRNVPVPYGEFLAKTPYQPDPQSAHGRINRGERVIHLIDLAADELYR